MITTALFIAAIGASAGSTSPAPAGSSLGTSEYVYRIQRISRTQSQIVADANATVAALSSVITLDQAKLTAWAARIVADPDETVWGRFVDGDPHIAIGFKARENDLTILNTYYLDQMPTSFPVSGSEDVGETAATALMEGIVDDLVAASVLPFDPDPSTARVGYMREGQRDASGVEQSWTTEYRFTMNRIEGDLVLPDAGITIGVHRRGIVSSVRIASLAFSRDARASLTHTMSSAQQQLEADLAASYPTGTVLVLEARTGALLDPTKSAERVDPSGIFNFVVEFPGGNVSRQLISRVSLVDGIVDHLYGP